MCSFVDWNLYEKASCVYVCVCWFANVLRLLNNWYLKFWHFYIEIWNSRSVFLQSILFHLHKSAYRDLIQLYHWRQRTPSPIPDTVSVWSPEPWQHPQSGDQACHGTFVRFHSKLHLRPEEQSTYNRDQISSNFKNLRYMRVGFKEIMCK